MTNRSLLILFLIAVVFYGCLPSNSDVGISASEQLVKDLQSIDAYLAANNITAFKDPRGPRYVIDSLGHGYTPRTDNVVKVKYVGKLLNNNIFDQGTLTGTLNNYISGWQIGVGLLPEGTKARIYIPSVLAYGSTAKGTIPANSNLIFEVTLLEVQTTSTELDKLKSDSTTIDNYLSSKGITAIKDTTGLRYVITTLGTGAKPGPFSQVTMTYTGKILSSGTTFYTGTATPSSDFESRVVNFLRAFQVGLPKLPKGSKATLYVPSGLGFGPNPPSGSVVTPNANLIFDVELTDVIN